MNDTTVISEIRAGRYVHVGKALYRHYPPVRKLVLKNSGSKEDAEDIYQEALLVLVKNAGNSQFTLTSSLGTYIYGVSRLLWFEKLRKNKPSVELTDKFLSNPLSDIDPADRNTSAAEEAIKQLGKNCRDLLKMFYYQNISMKDIAAKLRFSTERVAINQKYRCMQKAREIYQEIIASNHE